MPTGYTSDLYEGKDVSFRDFVLCCSRGMGARIMERENPMSDYQIKYSEPSTYHKDALAKAKERRARLISMTLVEADAAAEAEHRTAVERHEESLTGDDAMRARYEAMLSRVSSWVPPTEDHEGLKKFMIQQLTESIDHDCPVDRGSWGQRPQRQTADEWLHAKIKSADWDVDYHRKHWKEEQERTANRNAWLRELDQSLQGVYV